MCQVYFVFIFNEILINFYSNERDFFFFFPCSVVCEDEKQAVAVKSQLQQLARPMYSNPPVHGALIVSIILSDPELKKLWLTEVKVISFFCLFLSIILV